MIVQTWLASQVPNKIPTFISTHVSIDKDPITGKTVFIFSVNPKHEFFKACKNENQIKKSVTICLEGMGFKGLEYISTDDMPDHWWNYSAC